MALWRCGPRYVRVRAVGRAVGVHEDAVVGFYNVLLGKGFQALRLALAQGGAALEAVAMAGMGLSTSAEQMVEYEGMIINALLAERRRFLGMTLQRVARLNDKLGGGSLTLLGVMYHEAGAYRGKRARDSGRGAILLTWALQLPYFLTGCAHAPGDGGAVSLSADGSCATSVIHHVSSTPSA